ncbi:1,4-alpha-glucan branching protein GlgB [Paracoccus fistulariae]|uniref:1,4-alpha-glucan branching enzyme GlgB n=1 Tax=Paracoccus fistulariae TaxID=658446 RepID=A0ABY7SKK6_9RHOB|nr:1,4-alpha-glucan branching protein GlgB [Paracoccus fistulariae]MDB6180724.1 1,4-alpha-glucan branching protein GlgB [Paracoccus fistulariae]WCR07047.1 1,4-alpha-glucan branching protein GlgB [Paracoccus fistulariae]
MSKSTRPPHLSDDAIRRLIEARHASPFEVLGPKPHGKQIWVTALLPDAVGLEAIVGKGTVELPRIEGPLFGGAIRNLKSGYRLRARFENGESWEFDDPYRFGPVMGEVDQYLIGEGTHRQLWKALGAHPITHEGVKGVHFAVWAPNARRVSVIGDFNQWDGRRHPMRPVGHTGVWEIFLPGLAEGTTYKYEISGQNGALLEKADPVGFGSQHPPETASVVRDISGYGWQDGDWMATRAARHRRDQPISIYEVHLGSWRHAEGGRSLSYKELAVQLVDYAKWMGFTHLELLPVSEFPFDGSWGYQPVGMYAPTIRFGPPHEFRDLVQAAHDAGLGVIMDWVPGHFPSDAHGLAQFDGTHLYEHADPREGFHQDWNTLIYNYGRTEVRNYLVANALYWLEEYHIDALRVDAVASMLYRDYSRKDGEWVPNRDGGRENYEAIDFMKDMNVQTYGRVDGIMTVAEESTAFPGVTTPVDAGGLGFGFKWNMGWMNDTLRYIEKDPIYRSYDHHLMTFPIDYSFSENFILPISHDEVVHGKGSMIAKMPGNEWEKFANLRAYYGFMWAHPGKKLLFMGCEFGQWQEWNHNQSLDWDALHGEKQRGLQALVRDLNHLYRDTPALYRRDCDPSGFRWIANDPERSTICFARFGDEGDKPVVVICNFTPVERQDVRVGVPVAGGWHEVMNSDAEQYGGGHRVNSGEMHSQPVEWDGLPNSISVTLPPLSVLIFRLG